MEQTTETLKPRSLKTARRVGACLLSAVAVMLPIAFTTHNDVLQVVLVAISILAGGFGLICLLGQDGEPDWESIHRNVSRADEEYIPGTAKWNAYHGGGIYRS